MADPRVTWRDVQASYDGLLSDYVEQHGTAPPTFSDLISDEQLAVLRESFVAADAIAGIQWSLASTYPVYGPSSEWVLRAFYVSGATERPGGLSPSQRELIQLALLCSEGNVLYIGIHVYWALCQDDDLTVDQVAQSLMLASVYVGVDAWSTAQDALTLTLKVLAAAAELQDRSYGAITDALKAAVESKGAG